MTDPRYPKRWASRLCWNLREYPTTVFWIATCAAFAAGTTGAIVLLVIILILELIIALHVFRHTYPYRQGRGDVPRGRRRR